MESLLLITYLPNLLLAWILSFVRSTIHSAVQGYTLDNFLESSVAFTSLVSHQVLATFCLLFCIPIVITLQPPFIVLHFGYTTATKLISLSLWSLHQSNLTNSFWSFASAAWNPSETCLLSVYWTKCDLIYHCMWLWTSFPWLSFKSIKTRQKYWCSAYFCKIQTKNLFVKMKISQGKKYHVISI